MNYGKRQSHRVLDNEIKRAAENTRLAYRNYEKARRAEGEALRRVEEAKERRAPKEEMELLLQESKKASAQMLEAWESLTNAQKWERATKESARQ